MHKGWHIAGTQIHFEEISPGGQDLCCKKGWLAVLQLLEALQPAARRWGGKAEGKGLEAQERQ